MKKILLHRSGADDIGATYDYRARKPSLFCGIDQFFESSEVSMDADVDVFVFRRLLKPYLTQFIEWAVKNGRKVVIDLDDDIWHIPKWNPAHTTYDQAALDLINYSLDLATHITVSTPTLAEVVGRPEKTTVLRNLVTAYSWPAVKPRANKPLRILWAGSGYHEKDIDLLVPVVERLAPELDAQFLFWGDIPEKLSQFARIRGAGGLGRLVPHHRFEGKVGIIDPVEYTAYIETLTAIAPDIALIPLTDEQFNHSKSNLKWLEMSMAGAAVVAADLPPYRCIEPDVDGVLVAPADVDGWCEAIRELVESAELRGLLAANARDRVIAEYNWYRVGENVHDFDMEDAGAEWREFFKNL